MGMYQYRITVNDVSGPITEYPGDKWANTAEQSDERGYSAKLERRLVTDLGLLDFFPDGLPKGYLKLKDQIVCAWETFAEIRA